MTPQQVRVLVVDDHAVVRAGMRLLLEREEGLELIDEAATAHESIFRALEHKPEVVLLDVNLPDGNGISFIPKLLEVSAASRIVVLSMRDEPSYVREAFAAGASGYVLKEAADAELITAVREVAAGGRYVNPALGARMVAEQAREAAEEAANPLSDREREVLRLLALGHTNQQIAKELFISVRTAETHRAHIMQKLRLDSRAELVRYALDHGLIA